MFFMELPNITLHYNSLSITSIPINFTPINQQIYLEILGEHKFCAGFYSIFIFTLYKWKCSDLKR